jgi:hypothetical protein
MSYRRRTRALGGARSPLQKVPRNLDHANAQWGKFLENSWRHVCRGASHEHQETNCVNDMIPTEVIGATAGAAVDHRCLNRLAIASYLDLLHGGHQTGDGYRHKERTTPAHNSFHCFDRRKSWPSPRPNRWNHWFHRSYQGQDSTRFPMSRIRSASSWARMTEKTRALPVCVTRFSSS